MGEHPARRVEPLWTAVDLHGGVEVRARVEDEVGVERRFRSSLADDDAAGAVTEDVGVGVGDRRDHAVGHRLLRHAQLAVHAGDDDIELGQDVVRMVERPVLEDVDLAAGQDAERREILVDARHDFELLA